MYLVAIVGLVALYLLDESGIFVEGCLSVLYDVLHGAVNATLRDTTCSLLAVVAVADGLANHVCASLLSSSYGLLLESSELGCSCFQLCIDIFALLL